MKYDPEEILGNWAMEYHDCGDFPHQVKIVHDGYAEDEDGNTDESEICYAIFVHKNSGDTNFTFPEHDVTHNLIGHRPEQECCFYVWLKEDTDGSVSVDVISDGDSDLDIDIFRKAIIKIEKDYQEGE